ncbi:hypothetical protein DFH09DRAFT_1331938 [Mycena vulgaris]|nr:hypothetical protein DFH09DRAFT_1331938 [Mycena vulgaris]
MSSTPAAIPVAYDWNAPQHAILPTAPPSNGGYPATNPLPLHRLQFTPLGLYDLRRRIGVFSSQPSLWNPYRRCWLSADLAWFVSGVSEDNQHHPGAGDGFFPEFHALRDSLPPKNVAGDAGIIARKSFHEAIRKLIWDLATMLDRTFGSTTMIMHSAGTTMPGTPAAPEYLRCSVYLPPLFLRHHPDSHQPISEIVQLYINFVGIPTVLKWKDNAKKCG